MPLLATDHNFNERILDGLLRRLPDLDIVLIRHVGMAEASDPDILAWAAQADRVMLTQDRETFVGFAYERVARGDPMSGVIEVSDQCSIGRASDDLLVLLGCTADDEWANQVHYIPL